MKDIIDNLKKYGTWKNQLAITINFIHSKDTDRRHVMHSRGDNVEIMTYDKAEEVMEKHLFKSLLNTVPECPSVLHVWVSKCLSALSAQVPEYPSTLVP